jgi:hypothetical protein
MLLVNDQQMHYHSIDAKDIVRVMRNALTAFIALSAKKDSLQSLGVQVAKMTGL